MDDAPHESRLGADRTLAALTAAQWDDVAERIDRLAAAWEQALHADGELPDLEHFAVGVDPQAAPRVWCELAKFDLERRWQAGRDPQPAEWYAVRYPVLGPPTEMPLDLLHEEVQVRLQRGQAVAADELQRRLGARGQPLIDLLGGWALPGTPTRSFASDGALSDVALAREEDWRRLRIGDTVGEFQLLATLGSGSFAQVFLARQATLERLVALKVSAAVGSEPQTLARLDHPRIVRVHDVRELADPPLRLLYMEVAPGGTLGDALATWRQSSRGEPLSGGLLLAAIDRRLQTLGMETSIDSTHRQLLAEAAWPDVVATIGAQLAEGLAYAHARGVLHRDLKPANVLLTAEGGAKLADFNVSFNGARAVENPADAFGGSLAYMSPEQLAACHPLLGGSPAQVRERSDLYALGVLLWELLTGTRPFADDESAERRPLLARLQRMIEARSRVDFDALAASLPPDCPAALRQTLRRCLEPDPAQRFGSAEELARALRLCLRPRTWGLLQPPTSPWQRAALRWPAAAVVLAGLVPNALVAAFNFGYNRERLLRETPELMQRFDDVQLVINVAAFATGIGIGAWLAADAWRKVRAADPAGRRAGGRRVLLFGGIASLLLLAIWTASGAAFPLAIDWGRPEERDWGFFAHFFLSLALCGFAATAYPYFLITWLAVRLFVPALVRSGLLAGPEPADVARVGRANRVHLALAALVPMLGVLLTVAFGVQQERVLLIVSGAGLVGFGAVWLLERTIDADLAALAQLPPGPGA
jgi:serine/threonine protein kinase